MASISPETVIFMGKLFIDFQEDLHIHMTNHPFSDISAEKISALGKVETFGLDSFVKNGGMFEGGE